MVKIYRRFHSKGLEIIAVPCNQFAGQEPRSNAQIRKWAKKSYGVTFPILKKQNVQGPRTTELFNFLRRHSKLWNAKKQKARLIPWNFAKFLVSDGGKKVEYFNPQVEPYDMMGAIIRALKGDAVVSHSEVTSL